MATSFKQALEASMNSNTENISIENPIVESTSTIYSEVMPLTESESFQVSNKYQWYTKYFDDNYSIIDSQKNVKVSNNQINLTQEENSQVIPFQLDRYYDGIDLTEMMFQIHFVNANGGEGFSVPINVTYSSDKIRFYWLVGNLETSIRGLLKFEIIAKGQNEKGQNYEWKTKPNTNEINVLESLSGNGIIEPGDGWDTYLENINQQVLQAQSAASEAKIAADNATNAVNTVDTKIASVSTEITNRVKADMETILVQYYTKTEVDRIIDNLDFTDVLNEVQTKIDAIDGLASLKIEYNTDTNTMTFKNGETVISSHVLSTNPTAEWTASFRNTVKTDIDQAVSIVSNALDETNSNVTEVQSELNSVKTSLQNNYYNTSQIDEKLLNKTDTSVVTALQNNIDQVKNTADGNKSNITVITSKLADLEEEINNANTDSTLRYTTSYDPESGLFSLIEISTDEDGSETETVVSTHIIQGGSGGGGNTSTTVKIDRITQSPVTATKDDKVIIKYAFSSVDSSGDETDVGTATWKVGNTTVATSTALQGENEFDISDYVTIGSQKITLTIVDSAGSLAVKTWTVQVIDVRLESSFNDQFTYPIGTVSFDYTPYGSISKDIHFILDGKELGIVTTASSGLPMSYTLPSQAHGSHLLEVYATATINNTQIETNHIFKDIIWYDESSEIPVIGCTQQNITVKQYDNTNIIYTVYSPATETPTVVLAVDGKIISTLTLTGSTHIWQYKSSDIGEHILTITCGSTVKTIHVTVEELGINIEPVTAGLAFDFNPSGKSNNDADRLWSDGTVSMTVSDNFDWVNGGYQIDSSGDQYFCVKAGTSAVINYKLFEDDAKRNGKEFKLIFRTTNVARADATFLSCLDNNIGLQMNVHEAYVYASAGNLYLPYSEEDIIEFEININKNTDLPMVMGYEDGVATRPMIYGDSHNFTQINPQFISIGSENCDVLIYRMKVYNTSLTDRGILNNFIADARNADEMISRYTRNQIYDENNLLTPESVAKACPDLKIIKLECPHFTNDKKDFVKNTNIECIHTGGDPILDNWVAKNCAHSGQGTTSNEYGAAGRNIDLLMCFDGEYTNSKITFDPTYKTILTLGDGTKYDDGTGKVSLTRTSVPTNYFNVKVNIASSENANNACGQKRYNRFLPYKSVAQQRDSRVKNTMEFVNCVLFLKESDPDISTHREFQDCEWHYYSLGNIGDSKKTDYTRVNDPSDPKEFVVEIMDNTLPNSTFSGTTEALAALDADMFDEEGTYGFRYEMSGISSEQRMNNIQTWRSFYRFVTTSTDEEFVRDLKNWFIVDSALYFYLFTERYTMIDNRAKNTFWHYSKHFITQVEANALGEDAKYYTIDDEAASINNGYRFDFWGYDKDTQLGTNNSGELTMTYGKEDTDYRIDGDQSSGFIFNGAESKFFCRIRDLMYDQLANMFIDRESQNCWSATGLINEFDEWQAQFPEELWRLDIERKYIRTYNNGNTRFLIQMMNGRKKYQRRQFERSQEKYMATKYFGTTATSDQIMFRCNTPSDAVVAPNYTLHLTPYSDMYLSVMFGATYRKKVRAKAGQQYSIDCPFETMDDTAVLIYCASQIQSVGDLSACYIHDNDFSKAIKLQELIIGNTTKGYQNVFLTNLGIGNNVLLKLLDIRNTPNLTSALNLSGCGNLEELYAEGSGLAGVAFANGGKIHTAHLPAITSLALKNLNYITDLQIVDFNNLETLIIENTTLVDSLSFINDSPHLNTVRLIGLDWTNKNLSDTAVLERLIKLRGIDANGYNTLIAVLTGNVHVAVARQKYLSDYNDTWPDLIITYDTLITQYAVTFKNWDGAILDVQYVDKGANAVDPTTRADNPISIPLRPSSVSTDYTFNGWDSSFDNIFANRTITAQYTESVRSYTIKYVARNYVVQETVAPYGSSVNYEGEIPTYTDEEVGYVYHLFSGWDKFGYVDGNKTINALYDRFEYIDGCFDNLDISDMTPVQIYALTKVNKEQDIVQMKDSITFSMGMDYSYGDIEENLLIAEETVFTGNNYVDTGIKLLETDSSWTLAIDYKWSDGNINNAVLAQCYQGDGSNGFKLWQASQPRISWGTSSINSATVNSRDMLILRHIKGETQLHVYKGNLPATTIDYSTLKANRATAATQTLVFGCARADDGVYENYAKGTIYWAKLWYADLGDGACKELAGWTHESITLEMAGFRKYYLSDGSGQKCSMTFLASHLLSNQMPLNGTTSNAGGWPSTSLNLFLNSRFYNAIPVQWKQLIKQCKISSSAGNKSKDVVTANCYITIPAIIELDAGFNYEPYSYEGETIPFITSNATRARKTLEGKTGSYFTRSPNTEYSSYFLTVTEDGNIDGYSYALYDKNILIELSI